MTQLGEPSNDDTNDASTTTQEAEVAVQSSIAVREEYKGKLLALLDAVLRDLRGQQSPTTTTFTAAAASIAKQRASPSSPGAKRTLAAPDRASSSKTHTGALPKAERVRIPQGKEMHVLGDWLLLVRAASVAVVEAVQTWRRVVHQGKPQPFEHNSESSSGNYLLAMCEDLDVLDTSVDLVEWLGFRLTRNPFIVRGALDDVMSDALDRAVHSARSLYFWTSGSKRRPVQTHAEAEAVPTTSSNQSSGPGSVSSVRGKTTAKPRVLPPPPALVKPLASILPEDDVVDGARISAAQRVLLDEEAFHGRVRSLREIRQYISSTAATSAACRDSGSGDRELSNSEVQYATVYDEVAALQTQIKYDRSMTALYVR